MVTGENVTEKVMLAPAGRRAGSAGSAAVPNAGPVPVTLMLLISVGAVPSLRAVTCTVDVPPTKVGENTTVPALCTVVAPPPAV